ncbi:MAG: tagatose-bisphosphate aldolase, partial [Dehalococcoidia bacterium]|nr:tagatose-bisphosphate aldolase [Dehalococcoidia bacterium]
TTVADRVKELAEIATKYAVPWYRKLGIEAQDLTTVTHDWYASY